MLRILLIVLFTTSFCLAQNYTSTIRGTVRDADTGLPLSGATVTLDKNSDGTSTDENGSFRFQEIAVGRYVLKISYLGYESVVIPEILLESGRENVQEVRLHASGQQLREATVTTNRPGAFNSVQEITIEQTMRYAATYLDPARVATSFPGVAAANDQANGLVIRGNSPNGMQWRLEGVEIVNPNHLSNAGTFSDRATTTGGGVNILSTQLLSNSFFLSGAFPAQYGNALSGILDMNLRKGNDEKTEFVAQVGLIGIDVAAEGPFSKKSKASYVANYRYSFTGLLSSIGIDFGGEANKFQDFSFNVNLPTKKAGTFSIFGLGGISENVFTAERDSTLWEVQKDGRDIIFKNKMGAGGITHNVSLGNRTSWNTVLVASGLTTIRQSYDVKIAANNRVLTDSDELSKVRFSANTYITHRVNDKNRIKAGLYATKQYDNIGLTRYWGGSEQQLTGWLIQPFINWTYKIADNITSELGLHSMISTLKTHILKGNSSTLEPRAAVKWQLNPSQQVSFSYGLHSQLQLPQVYLAQYSTTQFAGNLHLKPTRSHHLVLGYQKNFVKNSSLKLEAYWQQMIDVPVTDGIRNSFSALNVIENEVNRRLENSGTGRNYGIEATYQKLLTDQYYILLSGSLYDATYVGSDGVRRDSRFNGRHTFSFTGGKEFKKGTQSTWGINAKILWVGGFRDTPIDIDASTASNTTVYLQDQAFSVKMKDYFRPDVRIYWKKSKTRYSRTLALDLQNISGTKNEAYSYYDTFKKKVVAQYQLGLIPVLSYRWEF
ncbi:TonB-dependent receptor [Dyadobacter luteus]|uniref:TonB-dependent receptor n=1 Tax=Dyadobacter luteus TaxID=2259619 RepID=A0A3D8YEK7_9BACT|nr:TonB-dependent receptor [Dyadobacter luteus]REA63026.1 TonB-dependent receptor [Dyadobacter luteus]